MKIQSLTYKFALMLYMFCCCFQQGVTQTSCYNQYIHDGLASFDNNAYEAAVATFQKILDCGGLKKREASLIIDYLEEARDKARLTASLKNLPKTIEELTNELERLEVKEGNTDFTSFMRIGLDSVRVYDFKKAKAQFLVAKDIAQEKNKEDLLRLAQQWYNIADEGINFSKEMLNRTIGDLAETKSELDAKRLLALRYAKESRMNSLALESEIARKATEYRKALFLAYKSLELSDSLATSSQKLTFGAAVAHTLVKLLTSEEKQIQQILFTENKEYLAIQFMEDSLLLIDTERDKSSSFSFVGKILSINNTPQGLRLLSTNEERNIQLRDDKGRLLISLKGHTDVVYKAQFSPDSQQILSCSSDNTARLWSAQGDSLAVLRGHNGNVYDARFSSNGTKILTRSSDSTVKVWESSGELLKTLDDKSIYTNTAFFSQDASMILTASHDSIARLWNIDSEQKNPRRLKKQDAAIQAAMFSPNGEQIITYALDNSIRAWGLDGGFLKTIHKHKSAITDVTFSNDQKKMLTASKDRTVMLWNNDMDSYPKILQHQAALLGVHFHPSDKFILSTSEDGISKLWSIEGELLMNIESQSKQLETAFFSKNGNTIFALVDGKLTEIPLPSRAYEYLKRETYFSDKEIEEWSKIYLSE